MKVDNSEIIELIKKQHKNTVFEALDISIDAFEPDVVVSLVVANCHLQHAGITHGGIYVLLAESAASVAGSLKVDIRKVQIFGMEINANHIRPTTLGQKISAKSRLIHQGRSTMVFGVDVTNEKSELVSVSRCTLAVRNKK